MSNTDLKEKLANINQLVNPVICELLTLDVEEKNKDVALYQCMVGGKRIRPALVILAGQLFGASADELIYPAASVEILHNSTLIIDDIIDHSDSRRDQPTCWSKYGQSIAECTAFTYLASTFGGLTKSNNSSRLIDLYSKTLKIIIDGEIKDILFERSGREDEPYVVNNRYKNITTDDYFEMIGQKTAVLLRACCQAGAIVANANDDQIYSVGEFGFNLGMAFQVRDDILDIFGDEKEFGKKIGKDIIEKKMGNFIILTAMEELDQNDREILRSLLEGDSQITDNEVQIVTSLINKTNAKNIAEKAANSFIEKSFGSLEQLPQNEYKDTLEQIANYIVNRDK